MNKSIHDKLDMHKFMHVFYLNAEQLALLMLLLNLCPGKLSTHSNLKYTYICKTLLFMITFIMFVRFLYYFANILFSGN